MFLCLDCNRVYHQKTLKYGMCKSRDCGGISVEVDELFIPVIAELNRKGYITKYCCSGHCGDNSGSYIYFEDYIKLPNLPEGYLYDQDLYPHVDWGKWGVKVTIRKNFDYQKNAVELSRDIFNNALKVLKWAEELSDMKG